jgi:hypothetical protein
MFGLLDKRSSTVVTKLCSLRNWPGDIESNAGTP